jgi:hypothetical protein
MGDGFARVSIDSVNQGFDDIVLPVPPHDEMTTLIDAVGGFIQWTKKDILVDNPEPASTPNDHHLKTKEMGTLPTTSVAPMTGVLLAMGQSSEEALPPRRY